jgi:pimeloyl-ACP methyl ester carboxylesterase
MTRRLRTCPTGRILKWLAYDPARESEAGERVVPVLQQDEVVIHYEVHGDGDPVLLMGGWGTYGHGNLRHAPKVLLSGYRLIVFDYRGIGASTDDGGPATMSRLADDAAAVLDAVDAGATHVVGIVGMGGCIAQELAIRRPELVRSLFLSGTWARVDATFADLMAAFLDAHRDSGFAAFQRLCAATAFDPDFYSHNRDRILGPTGAWSDLDGHLDTHARLTEACLTHDTTGRLAGVSAPALVLHAGADVITPPRLTEALAGELGDPESVTWPDLAHVVAGRQQRTQFDALLAGFLNRVG